MFFLSINALLRIKNTQYSIIALCICISTALHAKKNNIDNDNYKSIAAEAGQSSRQSKIPHAKWTVLIYVQASNSLSNFAGKNLTDMASIGSNKDFNILVQWYKPSNEGIWRYRVEKGHLSLDSHMRVNTDGSSAKDLIDAMQWATSRYPAENYGLILWNHGIGIVDPEWGESVMKMNGSRAKNNPRACIDGITQLVDDTAKSTTRSLTQCELFPKLLPNCNDHQAYRGILFNEKTKTYMNNQSLVHALHTIKTTILNNKKIQLLGMDMCLMAMAEVGYQVREFADILVASQEVELAYGWNYASFLQGLITHHASPRDIAKNIVTGYESLYKNKIHFYTQSALDLDFMDDLKNGIDLTVLCLNECKKVNAPGIVDIVKRARTSALQFSSSTYIDLHSFYNELRRNLVTTYHNKATPPTKTVAAKVQELIDVIDLCKQIIEKTTIASTAGKYLSKARGVSIYYPHNEEIDASYKNTLFAQDSLWLSFLTKFAPCIGK